jgi:hypothetical protein
LCGRSEGKVLELSGYRPARRESGQVVALVVAGVFVVAAVLDSRPGTVDNAVNLAFGITGFVFSRRARAARGFLIWGAVAYLLFWQFGTVVDRSLVPFHTTNPVVHLALVASMIGLAVLGGGERASRAPAPVESLPAYVGDSVRRPTRNRPPGRDDRRTTRRPALDYRA